jgi:calcineurin-like phosphoesterase family protein
MAFICLPLLVVVFVLDYFFHFTTTDAFSATDKILEKRIILWILGDFSTQRRNRRCAATALWRVAKAKGARD